jgi:type I restriction enzyme S subunit
MGEGSHNNINGKKVKDYPISLPPLTEQERIVNILDRMDKTHKELCKSIEDEIKMRKQQYEYYRNQLLDFKKKED